MSFVTIGNMCCGQFRLDGPFCPLCGKRLEATLTGVTVAPHTREMHPADYGQRTLEATEPLKPETDMQKVIKGLKAQGLIEKRTVETTNTKPAQPLRIKGVKVLVTLDNGQVETLYSGEYEKPLGETEFIIEQKRPIEAVYDGTFGSYGAPSGYRQSGPITLVLTVVDKSGVGKKIG